MASPSRAWFAVLGSILAVVVESSAGGVARAQCIAQVAPSPDGTSMFYVGGSTPLPCVDATSCDTGLGSCEATSTGSRFCVPRDWVAACDFSCPCPVGTTMRTFPDGMGGGICLCARPDMPCAFAPTPTQQFTLCHVRPGGPYRIGDFREGDCDADGIPNACEPAAFCDPCVPPTLTGECAMFTWTRPVGRCADAGTAPRPDAGTVRVDASAALPDAGAPMDAGVATPPVDFDTVYRGGGGVACQAAAGARGADAAVLACLGAAAMLARRRRPRLPRR